MNTLQQTQFRPTAFPKRNSTKSNISSFINSVGCGSCGINTLCNTGNIDIAQPKHLVSITQHPKALHPRDHLFRQGDDFRNLYVVRTGSIKLYTTNHDGSEQIIGFYYAGEILSFSSIETGLHDSSAEALETASVCVMSYDKIKKLCHHQPDFYDQLFSILTREINVAHKLLSLLGRKQAEERFAFFLMDVAKRTSKKLSIQYEFTLTMTRHEIANYLCLADETISRLISSFVNKGILKTKSRQIEILDFEKLQVFANIWKPQFDIAIN